MQNQKLLFTAAVLVAFGSALALVSLVGGSRHAAALTPTPTPTATPCPIHEVPDPDGEGCHKVTQTPKPTATPCPPDWEIGPKGNCVRGTPPGFPTHTATPCPTHKAPDVITGSGCGTITPTPTSNRPYGAQVTLLDHYPSPAVSGLKKTWVFELENVGSQDGCESHEVTLSAQLTGQSDAGYISSATLGCHETTQVNISSIVTVPLNAKVSIRAHASAGAAQGNTIEISETVVDPPPPTVPPTPPRLLGDFNCDGIVNSIDAALVLRVSAGLAVPLPCTGDGDVNHDGELNPLDAFLMLQYHAGLITTFP